MLDDEQETTEEAVVENGGALVEEEGANGNGPEPDAAGDEENLVIPFPEAQTVLTDETADGDDSALDINDGENSQSEEPEAEGEAEEAESEAEEEEEGEALPLISVVEALLFAAREPLKPAQIARAVGKRTRQEAVRAAVDELNVHYLETGRSFEIAEISGRYQLMSRPEYVKNIMRIYPKRELNDKDKSHRLTPAALDTLSIIAYKQPVTRAEIERIRGVGCGPALRMLIERGSVRVAGKKEDVLGQPLVYGTTEAFLAEFGLGSLDELPMRNEFIAAGITEPPPLAESFAEESEASEAPAGDEPEETSTPVSDTSEETEEPLAQKEVAASETDKCDETAEGSEEAAAEEFESDGEDVVADDEKE